jgi:hypothetical protein
MQGYEPDKGHDAVHGYKQLYSSDPQNGRRVDVLIDRPEMCHELYFRNQLIADYPRPPPAELLVSKLQIFKINKNILDVLVLLSEYPLAERDDNAINIRPVIDACTADWGWWRTLTGNLDRIASYFEQDLTPSDVNVGHSPAHDPLSQLHRLHERDTWRSGDGGAVAQQARATS